jgi:rubrerythrin
VGRFSENPINWSPFAICRDGEKAPYPRSLQTPEGLGDRLRFVAFAEKQATHAFALAADTYPDLDEGVREIWRILAAEEQKHLQWLLWRMEELGVDVAGRPQSLALWKSFDRCETAQAFADFMANAEERGRVAGEQFYQTLLAIDPVTARIFQQIAWEEREHIRLAKSIIDLNFRIPPDFDRKVEGIPLERYSELRSPE